VLDRGEGGERVQVTLVERCGRREGDDGGPCRAPDQSGRGVQGGHPALVDHGDPVAQSLCLLHEVGDEEDGDTARADVLDELPGVAAGARVQAGGELVEDDDPRVADQGERDEQALLLAAGELREPGGQLGGEPQALGKRAPVQGTWTEGGVQLQGLTDGELGLQFALLELGAEDAGHARVVGHGVEAGDPDPARVGDAQALDALDGGGLAGAVRAEDPEDLALLDGEGDAVDDGPVAVGLAQSADFDD
jgi:hypothetical protein